VICSLRGIKETAFFRIDDYMAMYSPYIKRPEARELEQCCVVGLMMDGDRNSVEPISEKDHSSERGMQKLLTEVKWDHDSAFGEYRRRMLAETADLRGVLVIDDTGFPKKGRHSVCVTRLPPHYFANSGCKHFQEKTVA
jgi:SRSO17 transposase